MIKAATINLSWLPSSWLYAGFALKRLWSRLNVGDRLVAVCALILVTALPISFIMRLSQLVAENNPQFVGLTIGVSVFILVSFALTGSMIKVRSHPWFRYLPETKDRNRTRILAEFLATCLLSTTLSVTVILLLPAENKVAILIQGLAILLAGHLFVHVVQLSLGSMTTLALDPSAASAMTSRTIVATFLANSMLGQLPKSTSFFMRKANANPLIWVLVLVTIVALGGAAISLRSVLLGLSSLSTITLIVQLSLLEPRVGNGPAIGAHSLNLPIKRARLDLIALTVPHLFCMVLALPFMVFDKSASSAAIAIGQLFATIWIIWLFLIVGALPAQQPAKSFLWFVGGALVSSQIFPPLILVWMVVITVILTRDLMRQSQQGPALWPR